MPTRYGLICVPAFVLLLCPALRHRGAPRKHLVCVRRQRILKPGLRIRCCRTQTRCLRGAPRCRRAGESNNTNAGTQMSPYLVGTSPHTQYHTRGRALMAQAPHTNESIHCHVPWPRTINVTCPSCTVYPTDPERPRTPTAELHHSGTMMPRHTIGNPR